MGCHQSKENAQQQLEEAHLANAPERRFSTIGPRDYSESVPVNQMVLDDGDTLEEKDPQGT